MSRKSNRHPSELIDVTDEDYKLLLDGQNDEIDAWWAEYAYIENGKVFFQYEGQQLEVIAPKNREKILGKNFIPDMDDSELYEIIRKKYLNINREYVKKWLLKGEGRAKTRRVRELVVPEELKSVKKESKPKSKPVPAKAPKKVVPTKKAAPKKKFISDDEISASDSESGDDTESEIGSESEAESEDYEDYE